MPWWTIIVGVLVLIVVLLMIFVPGKS